MKNQIKISDRRGINELFIILVDLKSINIAITYWFDEHWKFRELAESHNVRVFGHSLAKED